ncbi:unnamed protein product, partial [Arabidopsis halleri]
MGDQEEEKTLLSSSDKLMIKQVMARMEKLFDAKLKAYQPELKKKRLSRSIDQKERETECYNYNDQRRFEQAIQQQSDVKGVKAVKQRQKESPASREDQFKEELLEILNAYNKPKKAKCALSSNSEDAKFAFPSESVKDICDLSEKTDLVLENDQACDKLILSKPVQPSSIVYVSQFSGISELIRPGTEHMLYETFPAEPLKTALCVSESLYESRSHLESESKVLGCENLFKHHNKDLFDSS